MQTPKLILGGGSIGKGTSLGNAETLRSVLIILKAVGADTIDCAHLYADSEAILGSVNAGDEFAIHTKLLGGFSPGSVTRSNVAKGIKESLDRLKVKQVDTLYIHAPDYTTPVADTLAGINDAFLSGAFKHFGISNYKPEDVEGIYNLCVANDYPVPTVYQGNYSAVARTYELTLFPTLRRLGIAFYAYSPMAGGFLAKTKEEILAGAGRFNKDSPGGALYVPMYKKESYLEALAKWAEVAKSADCSRAELAYRWVAHNSSLDGELQDGILIGASSVTQLQQTLAGIKRGPLSQGVCAQIDDMWEHIRHEAPLDNFHL